MIIINGIPIGDIQNVNNIDLGNIQHTKIERDIIDVEYEDLSDELNKEENESKRIEKTT